MALNGPPGQATCCFCYCQLFVLTGVSNQMLVGWTPNVNRFVRYDNLCRGHTTGAVGKKKKKMESNSFLLTSISCSWIRTFLSLFPYVCMCFVTVYLVYVDCMLGTHPPRERESASSVENEIKVIDRLPVASLVDTTPPRPTSVSHLSLQYFLLMDWGDVGGMRFLVFYQLNDTFLFDFFSPLLFIHFTHFTQ